MEKAICKVEICPDFAAKGRCGWCYRHYHLNRVYSNPLGGPYEGRRRTDPRGCSIKDCPDPHYGLGWCLTHWTNNRLRGNPEKAAGPNVGRQRKYDLDDSFFDVIDTEAKAYWLGFINADGNVRAGSSGAGGWQRHALTVKLKESDAGHLEKLKADLSAQSPVYPVPRGSGAEIALSSVQLVTSLIRLGVTPRKSLTATPWDGPDHLMRHYWRGMFDGDGSISVMARSSRTNWRLNLCGSKACVEGFRDWAVPVCGSAARVRPQRNIYVWTAGGLASPQLLARELYRDATVYLDRKHALALRLMAAPIRHRSKTTRFIAA